MSLKEYVKKRDFKKTSEPKAGASKDKDHLIFVVQKHRAHRAGLHWDFRLEHDGVLWSWAVRKGPSLDPKERRLAVEVEDHPLAYGDFEGTIPKGEYGGGTVMLWDRGFWTPDEKRDPSRSLEKGELKFTLAGSKIKGSWVLVRMRGDRFGGKRTNWLLIKHHDAESTTGNGESLLDDDRSVASGRTMQQIADGKGKRPKPFMLTGAPSATADAVWHSREAGASAVEREVAGALQVFVKTFGERDPEAPRVLSRAEEGAEHEHVVVRRVLAVYAVVANVS